MDLPQYSNNVKNNLLEDSLRFALDMVPRICALSELNSKIQALNYDIYKYQYYGNHLGSNYSMLQRDEVKREYNAKLVGTTILGILGGVCILMQILNSSNQRN